MEYDFELFKDNVKHRIKNDGQLIFIRDTLVNNDIEKLWYDGYELCAIYMLAMVDYLSKLNRIPIYNKYDDLRRYRFEETVYPKSILMMAAVLKRQPDEFATDAIDEFKNIILSKAIYLMLHKKIGEC